MITLKIDAAKKQFFNGDKILKQVEHSKSRAYSRIGAFVRSVMRRLIRRSKKISAPGKPPKSHTGKLRDNIFFIKHPRGVVIGPALLNGSSDVEPQGQSVPDTLETGGRVLIRQLFYRGKWQSVNAVPRRYRAGLKERRTQGKIKKRPYAIEALRVAHKNKSMESFFKLVGPGSAST